MGLIVSRHERHPFAVPFKRGDGAWVMPNCMGEAQLVEAVDMQEAIQKFKEE